MLRNVLAIIGAVIFLLLFAAWFVLLRGSGGINRLVAITGIYAVCMPKGYDVVCFGDTTGPGLSCVPLAQAGGTCH